MTAAMTAKPKSVRRMITSGNLYGMVIALLSSGGVATYVHYTPTAGIVEAKAAADNAVAKAAVLEATVSTHTDELRGISASVDTLRIDVAVLKSQGEAAALAATAESAKLDRILSAVGRLQGAAGQPVPPGR